MAWRSSNGQMVGSPMRVVGLMSGTSGDGVDAALVEIGGQGEQLEVRLVSFAGTSFSPDLQRRLLRAALEGSVREICYLNALLGEIFARAALKVIKQAKLTPSEIDLIGSHGQTVHHLPVGRREPGIGLVRATLQIAEASVIAERTGVTTVGNFRARDMAVGGEGAPLAPYAHYVLLRDPDRTRLVVNLGGISNVTVLARGAGLDRVQAFDTGPANMVLDGLIQQMTKGRLSMDCQGVMARSGRVDAALLTELLRHPYLRRRPPKSTGREEFGAEFVARIRAIQKRRKLVDRDVMATGARFTAECIGAARRWLPGEIDEVIVGGGGVRNRAVMGHLAQVLAPAPVRTLDEVGWSSKAFEAVAFALLAYQTIHGKPNNVPSVTGASRAVVLGHLVPGRPESVLRLLHRLGTPER
ncbi:MAG TPA: anhydro-N-acetylmuramic acid kinase [Nitrospiraceae bacterium]|nr:anhydro-N-acetylmuramic acid kinase [Nitrospiraceae bacterium]